MPNFCVGGLTNQNCPLSLGNGRAVQNGARALHGFDVAGSVLATIFAAISALS
jgi:hypothetical protein